LVTFWVVVFLAGQPAGGSIVRENEFKHFGVAKELRGSGSSLSLLHAIEADLFQKVP